MVKRILKKFLIVEDSAAVARSLWRTISEYAAPASIEVAACVEEARRILWAAPLAAATIDLGLPDGDGLDLACEIRELYPDVPLLVLTGSPDRTNDAARRGIVLALKPCGAEVLEPFVRSALSRTGDTDSAVRRLADFAEKNGLTPTERALVLASLRSARRQDLARALARSPETIKSHVASILGKTGCRRLEDVTRRLRNA